MNDVPQMAITMKYDRGSVTVALVGELDIAVAKDIRDTIKELIVDNEALVSMRMDVTRVSFIDSSGLSSLLQARLTAIEYGLTFTFMASPDGAVVRLVKLSGLEKRFGLPQADGDGELACKRDSVTSKRR